MMTKAILHPIARKVLADQLGIYRQQIQGERKTLSLFESKPEKVANSPRLLEALNDMTANITDLQIRIDALQSTLEEFS